MKKPYRLLACIALLWSVAGCSYKDLLGFPSGDSGGVTRQERDVSGRKTIALGGMDEGSDVLLFTDGDLTDLQNLDVDLMSLDPIPGFISIDRGNGAKIIPREEGIGYLQPTVDGLSIDPVEVTIPPQQLIQILMGEARGELSREASVHNGKVKESSLSITGEAVGAVIRNRIHLIMEADQPSLFAADEDEFFSNPPVSYYEAVIQGVSGSVYQFSPVDPDDPGHSFFEDSAFRQNLETDDDSVLRAYDQAVWTAGAIFNDSAMDETGGAFGFYSPTSDQFSELADALDSQDSTLPEGVGTSDQQFPALAPIQILILNNVAPSLQDEDVPSFVFVRSRQAGEPAVTDQP